VNIVALVKYSLDVGEIKVDPATSELRSASAPRRFGNTDKNVIEGAVRLKEAAGDGATLRTLTLGPADALDGFKDLLAMGVDEAVLIEDPFAGDAEGAVAVRLLEAALRRLEPAEVVVCGFASDDGYSYQVPPRLAERLGRPLVSYVRSMEVREDCLQAVQNLGDRLQTVTAPLPVVVSIDEEAFQPRRTTLMDALRAKQKPAIVWQAELDLDLAPAELMAASHVASVTLQGIVINRRHKVLKGGDIAELASRFIDELEHAGVVEGGS
jgi:electron transfer flavoprotein beta subunit